MIRQRIQIRERFDIPFIHFARKRVGVALDAVKHRRREPRSDAAVRAKQVFEQNGGRGAIARANVFDVALVIELFGMMIDDEIDQFGRIGQVRRLKIHHGDAIEIVDRVLRDFFDFNLQQLHHRNIFGARYPAKRT